MNDGAYDSWKARAEERDDEQLPCPVCTGHEDAEPCTPACEYTVRRAGFVKRLRGYRAAAKQAVRFARRYDREEGARGLRGAACRHQAQRYLDEVRSLRIRMALEANRFLAEADGIDDVDAEIAEAAQ